MQPMRILYASERPPYPYFLGGAARCAHRLLLSLADDHGIDCAAVGSTDYRVTPWARPRPAEFATLGIHHPSTARGPRAEGPAGEVIDCGYPVHLLPEFHRSVPAFMDRFAPDLVWSQLEGAGALLKLARTRGIQALLYVHDAEDDPRQLRATADLGCHVVCSSAFLARRVGKVIGRAAHVVYPASDWHFGTSGDPQGFVTMINPHRVKGLETCLELARRLPEQRFLLQESWKLGETALAALRERLASLPNVTFQPRVPDMREVYAKTRLLLAPSVWEEGFGMVVVEAQSCGIPVIASARGGLPESVGDGGMLIEDYLEPAAWVEAMAPLLSDDQAYRDASARAMRHAASAEFMPKELARRLMAVCSAPAPRAGAFAHGLRTLREGLDKLVGWGRTVPGAGK